MNGGYWSRRALSIVQTEVVTVMTARGPEHRHISQIPTCFKSSPWIVSGVNVDSIAGQFNSEIS